MELWGGIRVDPCRRAGAPPVPQPSGSGGRAPGPDPSNPMPTRATNRALCLGPDFGPRSAKTRTHQGPPRQTFTKYRRSVETNAHGNQYPPKPRVHQSPDSPKPTVGLCFRGREARGPRCRTGTTRRTVKNGGPHCHPRRARVAIRVGPESVVASRDRDGRVPSFTIDDPRAQARAGPGPSRLCPGQRVRVAARARRGRR